MWGLMLSLPWRWLLPPGNDAILASQLWPLFLTAYSAYWGVVAARLDLLKRKLCCVTSLDQALGWLTDMQRMGYFFNWLVRTFSIMNVSGRHGPAVNIFMLCNYSERSTHISLPQTSLSPVLQVSEQATNHQAWLINNYRFTS